MNSYYAKAGLNQFEKDIVALSPQKMKTNKNQLICLWGPNVFLLNRGLQIGLKSWQGSINRFDQKDFINEEDFRSIWTERGLFEDQCLTVISKAEGLKSLGKYLKQLSKLSDLNGSLILSIKTNSLAKSTETELKRIGSALINCPKLYQRDTDDLIKILLNEYQLRFDHSARSLLQEALGDDAFKIENEIRKLSLIFSDRLDLRIQAKDLAPLIGMLRSDHAFSLNQYLLHQRFEKAETLVSDLLFRGESALAIVGILARHIRTSLYYKGNRTQKTAKPALIARLPANVERDYLSYVANCSAKQLALALCLCQEADTKLKSSKRLPEDIALFQIISALK